MSPHANPSQTRCDERCRLVRVGAAGEHHRQRRQRLGLRELLPERLPEVRKPVQGAALIGAARSTVTACANRPIATTVGQSVPGSVIGARAAFAPNTRPSQQPEQSILGLRRHEHDLFATAGGHAAAYDPSSRIGIRQTHSSSFALQQHDEQRTPCWRVW